MAKDAGERELLLKRGGTYDGTPHWNVIYTMGFAVLALGAVTFLVFGRLPKPSTMQGQECQGGEPTLLILGAHHKSGTEFMMAAHRALAAKGLATVLPDQPGKQSQMFNMLNHNFADQDAMWEISKPCQKEVLTGKCKGVYIQYYWHWWSAHVNSAMEAIADPSEEEMTVFRQGGGCGGNPNYKVVHFVRDPIEMVPSCYRHMKIGTEPWMFNKVTEDWPKNPYSHSVFEAGYDANTNPTLQQVANNVPVKRGLGMAWRVEAQDIYSMVHAYKVANKDDRQLNVRMEDFERDFEGTWMRVVRFIHAPEQVDGNTMARYMDALQITKLDPTKNVHATRDDITADEAYMQCELAVEHRPELVDLRKAMDYGDFTPQTCRSY